MNKTDDALIRELIEAAMEWQNMQDVRALDRLDAARRAVAARMTERRPVAA